MDQSPDTSRRLTDEQKIQLIDSMRNKGSYEAARERLTATARIIADRVSAAIPGQTWKFTEDPAGRKADREGLSCKELTGDIARRPIADAVIFGTAFSAEDFKVVTNIVREEAAKYGATTESSLFNESAKRDYDVQGNEAQYAEMWAQDAVAMYGYAAASASASRLIPFAARRRPPTPLGWSHRWLRSRRCLDCCNDFRRLHRSAGRIPMIGGSCGCWARLPPRKGRRSFVCSVSRTSRRAWRSSSPRSHSS